MQLLQHGRIKDAMQWVTKAIERRVAPFLVDILLASVFLVVVWPYILQGTTKLKAALMGSGRDEERERVLRVLHERQQASASTRLGDGDGNGNASSPTSREEQENDSTLGNSTRQVLRHLNPSSQTCGAIKQAPAAESGALEEIPSTASSHHESSIHAPEIAGKYPEILPLESLRELLDYEKPQWGQSFARAGAKKRFVTPPFQRLRSRLLVCHDMAGGYGEDRRVQGGGYDMAYRLYDWGLIDIFVYFSHNLVTIPPAGWIDVAHRHGTRVLGTFITEWDAGYDVCAELLGSRETADRAAERLAKIAVDHGFDGWLVNIENKIDPGANIEMMIYFLKTLTIKMRSETTTSSSTVLWYDSVTVDGELAWQDALNSKNRVFFDACNGIYTNYCWKDDTPSACALEASARRFDVYMGIDTYGRGTWGGGGFDCVKALAKLRRAGVSAALFAPGWTMEDKTPGGGKIGPDGKGRVRLWTDVEKEFGDVDGEFWEKIAAVWTAPRCIPGGWDKSGGGSGRDSSSLPVVVNFGRGVGDRWRICGEDVAAFVAENDGISTSNNNGNNIAAVGGAFYNTTSQCLTPLIGARRGRGQVSDVVPARRIGDPSDAVGGAYGTIGAKFSFAESFDGGSSLCFTGVLNAKAIATFPLYSCEILLPPEPLEVRLTFSANAESEIALVLVLDGPKQLGSYKEIVLKHRGPEERTELRNTKGMPSTKRVLSKRLQFTESHAAYAPVWEERSCEVVKGVPVDQALQDRIRALRESGMPYEDIGKTLSVERAKDQADSTVAQTGSTTTLRLRRQGGEGTKTDGNLSPPLSRAWTTRKYVIGDLRMGGRLAVRDIRVVCSRRKTPGSKVENLPGRRVGGEADIEQIKGPRLPDAGGVRERELRGVAGLAAYRCCLGEVVIGPWRRDAGRAFRKVEHLRAVELSFHDVEDETGSLEDKVVVVDLSLEWQLSDLGGGGGGNDDEQSNRHADSKLLSNPVSEVLHWDLWEAVETGKGNGPDDCEGVDGWRWLGRAYGFKYRLLGLRVKRGDGRNAMLAAQQVNAMGYRQPVEEWAKLELSLLSSAS